MDDTPNKMLEDVVRSLGGSKAVAPKLWPEKSVLDAQKTLCDCLNDDRPAKLDFAQVLLILRMARDAGHHGAMQWIAGDVGYEARAVTREEEVDRLAFVVEQSSRTLATAVAALERMQRARAVA